MPTIMSTAQAQFFGLNGLFVMNSTHHQESRADYSEQ